MISDEVLQKVKDRLVNGFNPSKIILFGSQARGTADDRSDVDILVICPFEDSRRQLMLEMDRSLRGLKLARDIVILTPEEFKRDRLIPGTVGRYASQEGMTLYEQSKF
jgi:predicted nucleotidyltransferase